VAHFFPGSGLQEEPETRVPERRHVPPLFRLKRSKISDDVVDVLLAR
jgi:hypothetical protein